MHVRCFAWVSFNPLTPCLALAISPLPDVVPNTLSEESSIEPTKFSEVSKPPRRPTRRVTSQELADSGPSAPPKSPEPEPETLQPRPRRVGIPQFFCAKDM